MTKIELPDEEDGSLDASFAEVQRVMREISADLADHRERLKTDIDGSAVRDVTKLLADIRAWSKLAIETEARFEERRKRREGLAQGQALDLEAARREIGCRLARLRRRCDQG